MKITVHLTDKSIDLVVNYETVTIGEIKHRVLEEMRKHPDHLRRLNNSALYSKPGQAKDALIVLCLDDKKLDDGMLLS